MAKYIRCPDCGSTAFNICKISEDKYKLKCWAKDCTKKTREFTTKSKEIENLIPKRVNVNCSSCNKGVFHISKISDNEYKLTCLSPKCVIKIRRFITDSEEMKELK